MGTATVASTEVRSSAGSVLNQSPTARLMMVRVGNTANQIISASWCLPGGCGPAGGDALPDMLSPLGSGMGASDEQTVGGLANGDAHVLLDQVGVDVDGGRGPTPAAVMTWARGFTTLPAAQSPGTLVRPVPSTTVQPDSSTATPGRMRRSWCGRKRGGTKRASMAI